MGLFDSRLEKIVILVIKRSVLNIDDDASKNENEIGYF